MKYLKIIVLFLITLVTNAQYTEVINSNRPGKSISPFSVGPSVYQVESGLFYGTPQNLDQNTWGLGINLRTGFINERFEVSLNGQYQIDNDIMAFDSINNQKNFYKQEGFSDFIVGAKYMFYMPTYKDPSKEIRSWKRKMAFDWKRLIPSVGFYAGVNTNVLSKPYKHPSLSPKAVILLQNDFSDYLIWTNNIIGNYLTNDSRQYGYISTLSYSIDERFSVFGEHEGMFAKSITTYRIGGGGAYLLTPNMQIGASINSNYYDNYSDLYTGIDFSWRLDRHVYKEVKEKDSSEKDGSKEDTKTQKTSIFKRLFGKKE